MFLHEIAKDIGAVTTSKPAPRSGNLKLRMVDVRDLVVDHTYQRRMDKRGHRLVVQICEAFDHRKFSPLVVSARKDGSMAVIDGQHRGVAASLLGIDTVPAMVLERLSVAQESDVFRAINSVRVAMQPLQVFWAGVEAQDPASVKVKKACDRAGVAVCRYPKPRTTIKVGETLSVAAVEDLVANNPAALTHAVLSVFSVEKSHGHFNRRFVRAFRDAFQRTPVDVEEAKRLSAGFNFQGVAHENHAVIADKIHTRIKLSFASEVPEAARGSGRARRAPLRLK